MTRPVADDAQASSIGRRMRRWIPDEQRLRAHPMLRWMGPMLRRPWLWHFSRRRVAMGVGIGVFFGFLVPVAQIFGAALLTLALRANLPAAAFATLISNPLTYAPIGIAAYRTGTALLGAPQAPQATQAITQAAQGDADEVLDPGWWERLQGVGKPLMLGLALFAVVGGVTSWLAVHLVWSVMVRLRRRRRRLRSP